MPDQMRIITGGALAGLLVAGMLALPSLLPAAIAEDEPMRTLFMSRDELLPQRVDGRDFVKPDFTVEPWVSTEVLSETTILKIGYGRTTFVTIAETATGTYSTDALNSPHIRYPGIVRNSEVGSFVTVVPFKGGAAIIGNRGSCIAVKFGHYC